MQRYGKKNLEKAVENLVNVVQVSKSVAIDHHFLRDVKWKEKVAGVFEELPKGHFFGCAAELMNEPIDMLEANRAKLYKEKPALKIERSTMP